MRIYREDRAALAALGDMRNYPVAEWREKGRGKWKKWQPLAWEVPDEIVRARGITPILGNIAFAIRERRSEAGEKGARTRQSKMWDFCVKNNLTPGIGEAAFYGKVELDDAKRIAENARWRHDETDYDELLGKGFSKEDARDLMKPIA